MDQHTRTVINWLIVRSQTEQATEPFRALRVVQEVGSPDSRSDSAIAVLDTLVMLGLLSQLPIDRTEYLPCPGPYVISKGQGDKLKQMSN